MTQRHSQAPQGRSDALFWAIIGQRIHGWTWILVGVPLVSELGLLLLAVSILRLLTTRQVATTASERSAG